MSKLFKDPVYEDGIIVSQIAQDIINTREFQRLRYIRQLGACYFVFTSATSSRFEHSIGVYHMTGLILEILRSKHPQMVFDLGSYGHSVLTDELIEIIKIAGLLHDIGHGPFSHLFDHIVKESNHEDRSKILLEILIRKKTDYGENVITLMKDIIDPPTKYENLPLFQIVANNITGIDSDKLDYLVRDAMQIEYKKPFEVKLIIANMLIIDNKITYSEVVADEILKMFVTRHSLHKKVYNHKTVKAIDIMLTDIFNLLEPLIGMRASVTDMNKFCKLTDYDFFHIMDKENYDLIDVHHHKNFKIACDIYERIINRRQYKVISGSKEIFHKLNEKFPNEILMKEIDIGFVSSSKPNPFDNILFYSPKDHKVSKKRPSQINILITDNYFETLVLLFIRNFEIGEKIDHDY